jgi:hypothetical protein
MTRRERALHAHIVERLHALDDDDEGRRLVLTLAARDLEIADELLAVAIAWQQRPSHAERVVKTGCRCH